MLVIGHFKYFTSCFF